MYMQLPVKLLLDNSFTILGLVQLSFFNTHCVVNVHNSHVFPIENQCLTNFTAGF